MEWIIIRNPKAKTNVVFDYMLPSELKNPLPHQRRMLKWVCDKVEFVNAENKKEAMNLLNKGDRLYWPTHRDEMQLISIGVKSNTNGK